MCPGYSSVLAKQLTALHGNLTAENTIRDVVPIVQTGDLHIAVYDLPNQVLYVANAKADYETGPAMAYDRWGKKEVKENQFLFKLHVSYTL